MFTLEETQGLRALFGHGPAGAKQLLDRLARGRVTLPPGVTAETLLKYQNVAELAISYGKDKVGTQGLRLRALQHLLDISRHG